MGLNKIHGAFKGLTVSCVSLCRLFHILVMWHFLISSQVGIRREIIPIKKSVFGYFWRFSFGFDLVSMGVTFVDSIRWETAMWPERC